MSSEQCCEGGLSIGFAFWEILRTGAQELTAAGDVVGSPKAFNSYCLQLTLLLAKTMLSFSYIVGLPVQS